MSWLPEAASSFAGRVDNVIWFVTLVSAFFFILISSLLVLYAVKYRRKSEDQVTPQYTSHHTLEVVWTVIPSIIVLFIFVYGLVVYDEMRLPPPDSIEIGVTGQQWLWKYSYDNGKTSVNDLYVPVNRPVKLVMGSDDVLHSFFVPAFRVKQDLVPGLYTYLWFKAIKEGEFDIFCAEYCGTSHSAMLGKVVVLSAEDYEQWMVAEETGTVENPIEFGAELYTKRGCVACHSISGAKGVGPTFKGLFGKTETLADGTTVSVDENYLRESIYEPQAKLVQGYAPLMPSFKGMVTESEVGALIAYIKSLN